MLWSKSLEKSIIQARITMSRVSLDNNQLWIKFTRGCDVKDVFTFPCWLGSILREMCSNDQLKTELSKIWLNEGASEIGLRSWSVSCELLVLGKETMSADFQRARTVLWETEALKIDEISALSDSGLVFSSQLGISFEPMAFCTLIFERATFTCAWEITYSSGTEGDTGREFKGGTSSATKQSESAMCSVNFSSFRVRPL